MREEKQRVKTAYQYKIRLKKAQERSGDLFGRYWEKLDLDLKKAKVRRISSKTAKRIILEYEWLGMMPSCASVQACYGVYFEDVCGGAVVYGWHTSYLKDFPSFKFDGDVFILHRGACCFWTPKNTASYLISHSLKLLKKDYSNIKIVTATVDSEAGEIGTIYQSLGWYFAGVIHPGTGFRKFVIDGKDVHPRTLFNRHKTCAVEVIKKIYGDKLKLEKYTPKERYFKFIGTRKENKYNYSRIEYLVKPYPKRNAV